MDETGRIKSFSAIRIAPHIGALVKRVEGLEKGAGVGRAGEKGIAQRIDQLESRIETLENK